VNLTISNHENCKIAKNDHLLIFFFFSSRRRHTRSKRDWSSDVCSSDLYLQEKFPVLLPCACYRGSGGPRPKRRMPSRETRFRGRSEERRVGKECRSRWSACD